jgi:hypothetical protein
MTQIEKAQAWFRTNGYTASIDLDEWNDEAYLCIQLWDIPLEESIDVYIHNKEIEYRAELWDEQQKSNQTKLC